MKVLLRNTQPLLGDRLMFTPVVRDLKLSYPDYEIGVFSAGPEMWNNNPYIDETITEHNADAVYDIGPAAVTRGSKTNGLHIIQSFRVCLEEKLGKKIKQGAFKPDIHLSNQEKERRFVTGRYWVINIDTGPFSAKRWPPERFQQLIDSMPEITFVQVGLSKDNQYRLKGSNVIDMMDRTKIRELFILVYNADGCISLVSSLMHVAAAFEKPCVVIAGGREPMTFEHYPFHRYLHTIGSLPCCKLQACWHNALSACKDNDGQTAHCMNLIPVEMVRYAINSYYEGGILKKNTVVSSQNTSVKLMPLLRIVTNAKCLGGAERSVIEIAKQFIKNNWRVEITASGNISPAFENALPPGVTITNHLSRPADCLLLYASDMVYNFDQEKFRIFENLPAKRKVMALTYKIGKAGDVPWTIGWDKYLFLSTTLCEQFKLKVKSEKLKVEAAVLAPCVDLEPFLICGNLRKSADKIKVVRHSSQGDSKYPISLLEIMAQTKAHYSFMPGPSWLVTGDRVQWTGYSDKPEDVAEFLSSGDLFWYLLPDGYTDQGPRVIVEAMAAGLPVIAENRDGAADRVTPETGWLINEHSEAIALINSLTPTIIAEKGKAARQRALSEFKPEKWFEEIINNG